MRAPLVDDIARFVRRLRVLGGTGPVPLLVVRVRDLERVAWREGRAAARTLERRALRTFLDTGSRTLRATDLIAHDQDSQDFLAALVSPTRHTGSVASPADCRATLARLASAMALENGLQVETGWTVLYGVGGDDHLDQTVEIALERGLRENERFAFFSTIGHELRTPLTSIQGYLETLLDDDSLDAATVRRFLGVMRAETTRLHRLVEGMFDVSMFDLRSGPVVLETSVTGEAIRAAADALRPLATDRGMRVELAGGIDHAVAIGGDRLTQIVINLIENALKHGRPGGLVRVSVTATTARTIEIRVDDDGPGIPAAEREAIFSLARRGSNARAHGSGLGLAVVRLMVERIGGEVDATDSVLGGAQFRLRLPPGEPGNATSAEGRLTAGDLATG